MDFRFGESEEQLRTDVQSFLRSALSAPEARFHADVPGGSDFNEALAFNQELAKKGWIAPAWPKEYGGLGATIFEQMVFNEEFGYYGAPDNGTRGFGVGMLGPTLIVHGTEAQKKEHLPRITSAEAVWCQAYSEPGAGSDLASLQTRAVRDGDDFVLNGQKIWTSGGHGANWIFVLARSDPNAPKHKGISFFMVDMNTPGLAVRPLVNMANRHDFNEVFFDDVRVPAANMIGEENRGWYVGMTLLDFERSGVARTGSQRRTLEALGRWPASLRSFVQFAVRIAQTRATALPVPARPPRMATERLALMRAESLSAAKLAITSFGRHLAGRPPRRVELGGAHATCWLADSIDSWQAEGSVTPADAEKLRISVEAPGVPGRPRSLRRASKGRLVEVGHPVT